MKVLILQLQVCHAHTKLMIIQLLSGCEQTHCNIPQARDAVIHNEWIPHARRDPALYSASIVDCQLNDHHGERSEIMVTLIPKVSSLCGGGSDRSLERRPLQRLNVRLVYYHQALAIGNEC